MHLTSVNSTRARRAMPFSSSIRRFKQHLFSLTLFVLVSVSSVANAQFDNGPPLLSGSSIDLLSDNNAPLHVAEDFMLPGSSPTISEVVWFGWNGPFTGTPPPRRGFNLQIYAGTATGPAGPPIYALDDLFPKRRQHNVAGAPALLYGVWPLYKYRFKLPSTISLSPGTPYWISIYASSTGTTSSTPFWAWVKTSHVGNNTMRVPPWIPYFDPVSFWLPPNSGEMAFKIKP